MARQDDWVRLQLRLPKDLHAKLQQAAASNSLNAEIVRRLEETFEVDTFMETFAPRVTIELDAGGQPVSWDVINAAVTKLVGAFPNPPTHVTIEVMTPEVIRRRAEIRALLANVEDEGD